MPQYPASSAQQRLAFYTALAPQVPLYNINTLIGIRGLLNIETLKAACLDVTARHESLRTSFQQTNDNLFQIIHDTLTPPITLTQMTSASPTEITTYELGLAKQNLDIENGPLFTINIIQVEPDYYHLLLSVHHIIFDGSSIHIFLEDLITAYNSRNHNTPIFPSELPIQYADYSAWQQSNLDTPQSTAHRNFWMQHLHNCQPTLDFPTDYPRPPAQSFRGKRQPFSLNLEELTTIRVFTAQNNTSLYATLFAALLVILNRHTNQNDITVGSAAANRTLPELEGLIGFFINSLPIRNQINPTASFQTLLQNTTQALLSAYEHQDYPFDQIVKHLDLPRDVSRHPLFQVIFTVQPPNPRLPQPDQLTFELLDPDLPADIAKFDIAISLRDNGETLSGFIEYDTSLFYLHFNNLVVQSAPGTGTAAFGPGLENAGSSRFKGFEIGTRYRLRPDLKLALNYSYHDSRFISFTDRSEGDVSGNQQTADCT